MLFIILEIERKWLTSHSSLNVTCLIWSMVLNLIPLLS